MCSPYYIFSQAITNGIVNQVIEDTCQDILDIKTNIEQMWITCPNQRLRRTMAASGIAGFTLAGDNVGKEQVYQLAIQTFVEIYVNF